VVESIAIMEYLMARDRPTPLAPAPHDPHFSAYQQFLHLGKAGLATLMMTVVVSRLIAPEAERGELRRDQVSAVVPEAAQAGQPTACQFALSRWRGFHCCRHLGDGVPVPLLQKLAVRDIVRSK